MAIRAIKEQLMGLAYPASEKVLRSLQTVQMSRTTTLRLIPPPSERGGGLGTTTYSEWCYTVGFFQSMIFNTLPKQRPLRMLDVGCGVGRLYLAARPYLGASDTYTGMDVSNSFLEICRRRYKDQNVSFVHLDASNPLYASDGSVENAPWPFEANSFNFVTALSVWTHLSERDFRFYLAELGRTLAPGGKALITFFILDDDYDATLSSRTDNQSHFYPQPSTMWIFDQPAYGSSSYFYPRWAEVPEVAIGVSKAAFDDAVAQANLKVVQYFSGCWKEQPGLHFQDIVVFERH